jgi:P-type Ca2+ transporter type 2C
MTGNRVTVQKVDTISNIPEDDLRTGDVVLVQAGDLVPADLKLLEAGGLEVDEWELTGEIAPVAKRVGAEDVFIYRGSRVTRGHGQGLVIAAGADTEYAQILNQRWELRARKPPALITRRALILLMLLLPPGVMALRHFDYSVFVYALAALASIVIVLLQSSELFAYVLTSNTVRRLAEQNIQVRAVAALDVIGHVDIACLDKTGILTTLAIAVKQVHFVDETPDRAWLSAVNERIDLTNIACALCNDVYYLAKQDQANPVDKALIAFAAQNGYALADVAPQYRRIYDQPFEADARYMAVGFEQHDRRLYFAKGAPEVIVKMCRSYLTAAGDERHLDFRFYDAVRIQIDAITQAGNIVIALAYRSGVSAEPPEQYALLGLIELENPLQPGVRKTIQWLKQAGIRPIMLTGDRAEAAVVVSRQAGIETRPQYYLTGQQIATMGLEEVARQAKYVSVFARMLPSHKGVLVRLLQRDQRRVVMVGDGANDTIALRAADVGVSLVEHSSPIARRVSQILITDLADLVTLIQIARRLKAREGDVELLRLAALLALFIGLYAGAWLTWR